MKIQQVVGFLGGFALAALSGCDGSDARAPQDPVWLDLSRQVVAQQDGAWVPVPRVVEAGRTGVEQAPGAALEFLLQPPQRAELQLERGESQGLPLVSVAVDGGEGWQPLAVEEDAQGTVRASLAPFAERPIRLRLANPTRATQRWWSPRVSAPPAPARPVLEVAPRPERLQRPNVILYVVDTLRADRLSLYGYERDTSPRLERLAERAFSFSNAYAPGSYTTPSITSLFGGFMPSALRGSLRRKGPLQRTLAEAFREAGYQTAAFQANFKLLPSLGYARGFEQWNLLKHGEPTAPTKVTAEELQAAALHWLDARGEGPFFLYLQTMDVHFPYDPPPPFGDRYTLTPEQRLARLTPEQRAEAEQGLARLTPEQAAVLTANEKLDPMRFFSPDRYDGAVAYADQMIGDFLEALRARGLEESTVVAITADHGEPLGQRGTYDHGLSLHEELVRIPLLLVVPWDRAPRRIESLVGLAELGPTLLELTGVERLPGATARSLLEPRDPRSAPFALGEQLDFTATRTLSWFVRQDRWKLILDAEGPHLYDLEADPSETRDVRAEHPTRTLYLEALARSHSPALLAKAAASEPADSVLTEKERSELDAALRALGYAE